MLMKLETFELMEIIESAVEVSLKNDDLSNLIDPSLYLYFFL